MKRSFVSVLCSIAIFLLIKESAGAFLGCYQENILNRVFSLSAGTYDPANINASSCSDVCLRWNFRYSAFTVAYCFCSDTLPANPLTTNAACGLTSDLVVVHESNIPVLNMKLSVTSPNPMKAGTLAVFSLTVDDSPAGMTYTMNFDDGAGPTQPNVTSMFQKVFNIPGTYKVVATASDGTTAGVVISVQMPVSGLQLYCPSNVALNEEFKCNATATSGTFMRAELSMGDGYTEAFPIGDAYWLRAGPGIPAHGTQGNLGTLSKTYFSLASIVKQNGEMFAVELHGATAGAIQIMHLRPACTAGTYGLNQNDCNGGTPHVYTCAAGQVFCPLCQACGLPTDATFTANANKFVNTKPNLQFSVQNSQTITIGLGYQMVTLGTKLDVLEGDIIAYTSTVGIISTRPLWSGEYGDLEFASSVIYVVNSGTVKSFKSLLSGVYTTKSTLLVVHTYTNLGFMPVNLNVSTGPDFIALNTTVLVAIGINDSQIINPSFGITNDPIRFELKPHTGSNITYSWQMGNGIIVPSWVGYIDYVYPQKGCYFVNGTSVNIISRKLSNMSYICIEDKIRNMTVWNNVSAVGLPTNFYFSMLTGSNYLCNWNFGDGTSQLTDEYSTPISGMLVQHTYPRDIAYQVNVTCYNNVSRQSFVFTQYIQWPIMNLRLDSNGALLNKPFTITFLIDNGTDPTFVFTFDGQVVPFTYNPATKKGISSTPFASMSIGVHKVEINGNNKFGKVYFVSNFSVEMEMIGISYSASPPAETGADIPITFTVKVQQGSGVNITLDYMDGTPVDSNIMPQSQVIDSAGLTANFIHTYTAGGEYSVQVYVSNSAKKLVYNISMNVFGRIENVTIVTNSPVIFKSGKGLACLNFVTPRTWLNHKLEMFWNDSTLIEANVFSTTAPFCHTYTQEGTYNIRANISNKLMWGILTASFVVSLQVENMELIPEQLHASAGVPFKMGVDFQSGGPNVDVTFDFGDPGTSGNLFKSRKTPGVILYNQHVYDTVGVYTISATAMNSIGNTTMYYKVVVEQKVPSTFGITISSVAIPTGTASVILTLPSNEILPTNANVTIFYGDDNYMNPAVMATLR